MRFQRSRRALALAAIGMLALSACGDDKKKEPTGAATGGAPAAVTGEVEVFSWWTGGGEARGLEAMIADFKTKYPGVEFVNAAVAGGAGTNAKAVLASRLQANDPPDSFQGHAGAELSDYIKAGQVEDLTFLYEQEKWKDIFPDSLLPLITVDGKIYSVPVNIHRANILWFNPGVLKEAGVAAPPKTVDEFIAALEAVKAKGKIPLALGEAWTQKHLLETVLLGSLGADKWTGLWNGSTDWRSPEVKTALANFDKVLSYTNKDAASLSWQDAAKLMVDGEAAFNIMGDWADGYFQELQKTPDTDYGWAATPGSDGVYQFLSDSFTLPKNAKHRDAAIAWLTEAGSKSGQDAFNPVKGSIPARSDADASKYGPYLKWALEQWKSTKIVGSLAHGVVANNAWNTEIDTVMQRFVQDHNVDKFQEGLAKAHETHGKA
jgi:glucose/mannose transport system substrate-binding protein